jgi:hypothetical protein
MAQQKTAISMGSIERELDMLGKYMPGERSLLHVYGRLLGERLRLLSKIGKPELTPGEFYIAASTLIMGLRIGEDIFAGQRIEFKEGVGFTQEDYDYLVGKIPDIAKVVCPKDFADDVKKTHDGVTRRISSYKNGRPTC